MGWYATILSPGSAIGVDLEEADGRDDLDHSNNRGDAGNPFSGFAGTTEGTSTTYPGSDAHRGKLPCTVGVRSIWMRGSTASFVVNPAERLKVLGDADGSLHVDENGGYEDCLLVRPRMAEARQRDLGRQRRRGRRRRRGQPGRASDRRVPEWVQAAGGGDGGFWSWSCARGR